MFPQINIGSFNISTFGVFLASGLLLGIFLIWRLARAWDYDEEKILDLILLTIIGGLIGARLYFVFENWVIFTKEPINIFLIHKALGFSFWGGVLGGSLALIYFTKHFNLNFWKIADIAIVGFIGGLILSNIGCFLEAVILEFLPLLFWVYLCQDLLGKDGRYNWWKEYF